MKMQENVIDTLDTICEVKEDDLKTDQTVKILVFDVGHAVTTFRVVLNDRQSGADLAITHMTTRPEKEQRRGFGSEALRELLGWAKNAKLTNIQAVQVSPQSKLFWEKNGFVSLGNETSDYRYQE